MASWSEFDQAAGELAKEGEARFERARIVLLGTIRKDGSPRISPVEAIITDGQLYLGMMWQSMKALDLLRDGRCVVHSTVSDPEGIEGEFKAYGRAFEVSDHEERERYCQALLSRIGWRPDGDFHLFKIDLSQVAFVYFTTGEQFIQRWRPGEPLAPAERRQVPG